MLGPVMRSLHMAKHYRGGSAQSNAVSRCYHVEPLLRPQLVGTKRRTHLIVQYLRCRTGKRAQTGILENRKIRPHAHAERGGAVTNLEGGESMDVEIRHSLLHGTTQGYVCIARIM